MIFCYGKRFWIALLRCTPLKGNQLFTPCRSESNSFRVGSLPGLIDWNTLNRIKLTAIKHRIRYKSDLTVKGPS